MEGSSFVKILPRLFKIGTYLDIETGNLNKVLISCRFLIGTALYILTFQNIINDLSGESKYAKTHDLFIIFILALSDVAFVRRNRQTLILVRYLLKPPFISKPIPTELARKYLRLTNVFGAVVGAMFAISLFWSFTPLLSFLNYDPNATPTTFNFPMNWITKSSDSFPIVALVTTASVFYMLSGILHFFTWYPVVAYCAIKMKLMTELLVLDLEILDDKAEQLAWDALRTIAATGRLPFCERCSDSPKVSADHSSDDEEIVPGRVIKLWKFDSRECCRTECKDNLKEFYVNKLLERVVEMHVEIIRFVRLVDRSFQLSILMYNQFAVVAVVLQVPKVSSVQSITGSEIMIVVFEVFGVLSFIGIFNLCGQIVLNEVRPLKLKSEEIRNALRSYIWYDKPISTQRRLLIMLTAATRPLRLTSGGIHTLSNETYSKVLSAAYSYASVIQSLKASVK